MQDAKVLRLLLIAVSAGLLCTCVWPKPLKCMDRFKFKDFVIGAWWGPDATEEGYKLYKDAGFNVVMQASRGQMPDEQLRLAEKLRLKVIIDTFTPNNRPWGGVQPPDVDPNEDGQHAARPGELEWLQERYGDHPALVGYLLNDNCGLHDYTVECARYLLKTAPGMFPWMSTNPDPAGQSKVPMPIITTQNYPFLYNFREPERTKRLIFCNTLERDRVDSNRYQMAIWPFVNVAGGVTPSQLRFQLFTSIAYGAQGIPYFFWHVWIGNGRRGPLFQTAKACNRYIASTVGPRVLGHRCIGVYHTPESEMPAGGLQPAPGQLVESMSSRLLAGVLVPEDSFLSGNNTPDYLMVVDKRTVKMPGKQLNSGALSEEQTAELVRQMASQEPQPRRLRIQFGAGVERVQVLLPRGRSQMYELGSNRAIHLNLSAGQGLLLKLN